MNFDNFLTLDYVGTFAGMVVITMMIVQFFKEIPLIKDLNTKYFTFIVALFNMFMYSFLVGTFAIENIYLMFINAMIITLTATGGYDFNNRQ